ncbi:response regulator [Mariniradius sediminis]|uniref:Response regulator n=1 Tax=Mariniradius sediminis TaxID=2909237 RepID=A0ABS9BQ60_9BACT|nr:response regulator [Mariniradius sediminis]MCF1749480.1 response regulator [Mariniradius sediminis]
MYATNLSKWDTTVLIENDPVLNFVNKRVLQLIGFKGDIQLFSDAKQAADFLDRHFDDLAKEPETRGKTMIFVDSDLPDIDAMDLLGKMDCLNPEKRSKVIPVLMVAGHPCDETCSCRKQREGLEVVTKPLIGSVLKRLIKNRLGKTLRRARKTIVPKTKGFLRFGKN